MTGNTHKKIAIVETGGSHDEVIKPQLLFLSDEGIDVHLIIRRKHYERTGPYHNLAGLLLLGEDIKLADRVRHLLEINQYLSRQGIKRVIINTAQGAFIRDLTAFSRRDIDFTGIAHNPQKLGKSLTQKMISRRVKKYFVLSDYILDNVKKGNPGLGLEAFYPVFFPSPAEKKTHDTLDVCIPGAVDLKRRDYQSLVSSIKAASPDKYIRFIFLGRCTSDEAKSFREEIEKLVPPSQLQFFDQFIPEDEFLSMVSGADLILPLITPNVPLFDLYSRFKITGAVNLAFGFRIPMLMHKSLQNIEDFRISSFFYGDQDLTETLNRLNSNRDELKKKKEEISGIHKFDFNFQKQRYLNFLEL